MTDKLALLTMTVLPDDTGHGLTVTTTVHQELNHMEILQAHNAITQTLLKQRNELMPPDKTN